MCNASNHPTGCTCGWGGDGHLGGGSYGGSARSTWGGGSGLDSPNALCPKCSAEVYFIRPQNGGAVWFDELGPPWPKHPCMDSTSSRRQYPEPLTTPYVKTLGRLNRLARTEAIIYPANGYWSILLNREQFVATEEPPEVLSPVYVVATEDQTIVELHYVSVQGGETRNVVMRAHPRGELRRLARPSAWNLFERWLNDLTDLDPQRSTELSESLREKIDWLLDPGWPTSLTSPTLVKTRVREVIGETVPQTKVYGWLQLLFP